MGRDTAAGGVADASRHAEHRQRRPVAGAERARSRLPQRPGDHARRGAARVRGLRRPPRRPRGCARDSRRRPAAPGPVGDPAGRYAGRDRRRASSRPRRRSTRRSSRSTSQSGRPSSAACTRCLSRQSASEVSRSRRDGCRRRRRGARDRFASRPPISAPIASGSRRRRVGSPADPGRAERRRFGHCPGRRQGARSAATRDQLKLSRSQAAAGKAAARPVARAAAPTLPPRRSGPRRCGT